MHQKTPLASPQLASPPKVNEAPHGPAQSEAAAQVRALSEAVSVGTIMSRPAMCLAPEASVGSVTEMFLDRDLNAAPVVDEQWLPLAMVSKTDLLRFWSRRAPVGGALSRHKGSGGGRRSQPMQAADARRRVGCPSQPEGPRAAPPTAHRAEAAATPSAAEGLTVADVTVPYVLSLHEEAPISVAAALMAYESVHRLPIVSSAGDVVGVVSALDIVRWLAQNTGMGAGK